MNMADNRDLKGKRPIEINYGSSPKEAFKRGERETKAYYRKKLVMCKEQTSAIVAKHEELVEVNRIQAKLELLHNIKSKKEQLRVDLILAKRKMADVKVPHIGWFKLGEPDMH